MRKIFFSFLSVHAVIIVISFTILGALSSIIRELQEALATRQYVYVSSFIIKKNYQRGLKDTERKPSGPLYIAVAHATMSPQFRPTYK
jgi:hypothetical protein